MRIDKKDKKEVIKLLVKAAFHVFAQKGYEKATVDEIVAQAGYSKGAFYYYFDSKEDLFLEIMDYRVEVQQEMFRDALLAEQNLSLNVSNLLSLFIKMCQEEPWVPMYIEFLAQASRNQKMRVRMANMYDNWRAFLAEIIERLKESEMISKEVSAENASGLIIALVDGFNLQNMITPNILSEQVLSSVIVQLLTSRN